MISGEATNTNFKVFGLTRLGLESMIYRTQGKHANHNTTDAVNSKYITNTDKPNENVQIIYYQLFFCLFGLLRYCFLFRCTHIQTALHTWYTFTFKYCNIIF